MTTQKKRDQKPTPNKTTTLYLYFSLTENAILFMFKYSKTFPSEKKKKEKKVQ